MLGLLACGGAGDAPDAGPADATGGDAGSPPTAAQLLDKVAACGGAAIKGGFGTDGPGAISMFACGSAVYWRADLDVDCDGVQTPPCDTDPTGQPQTSIVDLAPAGDVDPTTLPYFVIPLGLPETAWYQSHGIALGQVGAVIYGGRVEYGIFADEAGGWFIGEASYAMCQRFLGAPSGGADPCSPIDGGIDPAEVTYVTFTGAGPRAVGPVIYDHAAHAALGESAASAWLREP
ncbi:MAG: glycoside hydrolase family 75 protein [Myxococcales bacterium]|nr:glycoside hydrolase family 75 protein [Myxococcales bacterium]